MVRKILNIATFGLAGAAGLLGKKKTTPASAPTAEQKGPIVTPLGAGPATAMRRKLVSGQVGGALSDKLGG